MSKGTKRALLFAAIPFVTLVFCLPFVNRVRPVILGLPFLLFWIVLWVVATPLALYLADQSRKRSGPPGGEDEP